MSLLFRFIKQLCCKLFQFINFIRLFILNILFIAIIALLVVTLNEEQEAPQIVQNSYLQLNLNGDLVEQKKILNLSQQLSQQLSNNEQDIPQEFVVQDVIKTIQHAQHNPKITGLILQLNGLKSASLNQLSDIGQAINAFKSEGKVVVAFSDNYSQTQYYLASYADTISLPPNGMVALQGFAVNRLYFKDLLDKLLVTPHIFKVGTYKSFVEPFTETKMSAYSKAANKHWLDQLWQGYIDSVLLQRKDNERLSVQSINPTLKQLTDALQAVHGDTAQYAFTAGLVDDLSFYDQFLVNLRNKAIEKSNRFNIVDYQVYAATLPPLYSVTGSENQIAVIYGTGEIISGRSDSTSIADKSFNALLKRALNDSRIKAVVIRLDTPGGSAFASENIRQQVLALKMAGKKVVVSMASVTASGGYWIAASADKIVASPSTLTGSIGIFGMFATIDKSLNKLGIYQDGVSTNALSNLSITQPLSPELAELFQLSVENGYANFLSIVSGGRKMTIAEVDKVAQGRVWTGLDGYKNGLVDELGNLQDAIELAAKLASLTEFDVIAIKPEVSPKQEFINNLFSDVVTLLPNSLGHQSSLISLFTSIENQADLLLRLNDPQSRFVYCTVCNIE